MLWAAWVLAQDDEGNDRSMLTQAWHSLSMDQTATQENEMSVCFMWR
jgi:hypothetical protein